MSSQAHPILATLNILLIALALLAWVSLLVAVLYFVMGIVGWRGPHRNRRFIRAVLFTLVFPCVFVLQQAVIHGVILPTMARESQYARQRRVDEVAYVKRGEKVPSFRIRDVEGNEFSTEQLRGKVVLVNFFATWCGPCILELPHIQEIWQSHRHKDDFALLVIGREETNASVREFRASREFSFPIAADPDRMIYGLFAKELIPRTYLIGRDGMICFESTGYVESDLVGLNREITKQLGRGK